MAIGSFNNPIAGANGVLTLNQITSDNFNPVGPVGWGFLKNGTLYAQSIITPSGTFIQVYSQSTAPTGTIAVGSLWFNIANGYQVSRWDGASWIAITWTGTDVIGAGTITGSIIAANTILAGNIAAGTITATQIAAATITGAKIAATTIAAGNIISGTITTTQIAAATITGGNIAATTITAGNIVSGTITTTQIAANTITAANIAANTITAAQLAAGIIYAGIVNGTTISGAVLNGGQIFGGVIESDSVSGGFFAYSSSPGPLNTNFNFGLGISPWTGGNGATVTASSLNTYLGSPGSMLITPNGSTANPFAQSETTIPVVAGQLYGATAQVFIPAGFSARVSVGWMTSGGTNISTSTGPTVVVAANTETQLTNPNLTAPGTAARARIIITLVGTPASSVLTYVGLSVLGNYGTLTGSMTPVSGVDQYGNSYAKNIQVGISGKPQVIIDPNHAIPFATSTTGAAIIMPTSATDEISAGGMQTAFAAGGTTFADTFLTAPLMEGSSGVTAWGAIDLRSTAGSTGANTSGSAQMAVLFGSSLPSANVAFTLTTDGTGTNPPSAVLFNSNLTIEDPSLGNVNYGADSTGAPVFTNINSGLSLNISGSKLANPGGIYPINVSNTASTSLGFMTVPGNDVETGSCYQLYASGGFTTGTTPSSATFTVYWGGIAGTSLVSIAVPNIVAGLSGAGWFLESEIDFTSTTATVATMQLFWHIGTGVANSITWSALGTQTGLTTTTNHNLSLGFQWGSAPGSTSLTVDSFRASRVA